MNSNKLFFSKRSSISGRKVLFYAIFSIIAAISAMLILYLVSSNKSAIAEIPSGLEDYLTAQRFLNSPICFVFQDGSNRAYPWVIDLEKFNQANMDKCYSAPDAKVNGYRLTLDHGKGKLTIITKNWEGFLKSAETKQVFIYNKGDVQKAELLIEMQNAK